MFISSYMYEKGFRCKNSYLFFHGSLFRQTPGSPASSMAALLFFASLCSIYKTQRLFSKPLNQIRIVDHPPDKIQEMRTHKRRRHQRQLNQYSRLKRVQPSPKPHAAEKCVDKKHIPRVISQVDKNRPQRWQMV